MLILSTHVLAQILKHLIKRFFKNIFFKYLNPILGPPKISFSFIKSFITTSMMLTCNLELYQDSFYFFCVKTNFISFWFTLIIIYPFIFRKNKSKNPFLSNLLFIIESAIAYFSGLLISFKAKSFYFSIFSISGFSVIALLRMVLLIRKRDKVKLFSLL